MGVGTAAGLGTVNGLNSTNGLASGSGLMTTSLGRAQVQYIVRCALPAGHSIVKQDQYGTNYTYTGLFGMGAGWESGACDQTCQEYVSACVMAHVNTAGLHVPIYVDAPAASVGWGQDPDFPNQEATFFGNVFNLNAHGSSGSTAPQFYCTGPQWNVSPWAGRVGGTQSNPPYVDPYGTNASCSPTCTPADYPHQTDGFKACSGWNYPVVVWRRPNNAPSATGTIDITTHTQQGIVLVPSPRQKDWADGVGVRNMDGN